MPRRQSQVGEALERRDGLPRDRARFRVLGGGDWAGGMRLRAERWRVQSQVGGY